MEIIEKFSKIMEANVKSKIGKLTQEQETYTDIKYIEQVIKEYLQKNKINYNIDFSNKQMMLNFINIEIIKFIKEK